MTVSQKSVEIARSFLGYKEGANNDTIFGKEFGTNFVAWCVEFVDSIYNRSGLKAGTDYPYTASSGEAVSWYKKNGLFNLSSSGYVPKAGDSIFIWDGSKVYHTGLVESVTNGVVNTIEGNAGKGSDSVIDNSYALTDSKIYGYGTPKFPGTDASGISFGQDPNESDLSGTIQPPPGALPKTRTETSGAPSVWGWITGQNGFLDGVTGKTGEQRKMSVTLVLMILGGIVLVLMAIGFVFGEDIITIAAPEAGVAMKAASAAKSE